MEFNFFSLVNYLELIQLLSITGTYAFNSLIILLFLLPSILFLKYKKKILNLVYQLFLY